MKKISFVLAIIMVMCVLPISVFAANATVSITSATAKAGEEVEITLAIKNSPGIAGAQFYVGYDSSVMTYVSGTPHSHKYESKVVDEYTVNTCECGHSYKTEDGIPATFFTALSPSEGANPVKVVFANLGLKNVTGDFTVAQIKFKINADAKAGEYDLSLSSVEADCAQGPENDIVKVPLTVKNATITVKGNTSAPSDSGPIGTTHKHNYKKTVVAPEGANPGYTLYECSCGHSYKGDYAYSDTPTVVAPKFEKQRDYSNNFTDVTADKWFEKYVRIAYEYKLANGTSASKFSPDNKFTVAQALTAAVNIHTTYNGTSVRAAATGEAWYVPYVEYCVEKEIVKEGQFTNFDANITRGDMAIVFANVLPESEYTAVKSGSNPDVTSDMACASAVQKLYQAGIVGGDAGSGNYRPNDEIVRSEACVIFTRIAVADERAK
ncbi:MAG: hypothetical protein E7598_07255 [Ruminococcaceae bacterium]|nr:hypothetical protein [Oscillospiraceae bacterium]